MLDKCFSLEAGECDTKNKSLDFRRIFLIILYRRDFTRMYSSMDEKKS